MDRYTIDMLVDPVFVNEMVHATNKNIEIILDDGHVAHMKLNTAIFHGFLWGPYIKLNIPITNEEIYNITAVNTGTIADIHSIQYKHLLSVTKIPHMEVVTMLWEVVNNIYQYVHSNLTQYQCSMSLMSLIEVVNTPGIKKIIKKKIPDDMGTKVAEVKFKQQAKELVDMLNDKKVIGGNALYPLLHAGALKMNQIPQLLNAYGTRSDLDDHMMKHVINASALSGMRSAKDLATESLSAKKTAYYNNRIISRTQYFARELRLNNMQFSKMYDGDCGSRELEPLTIQKGQGRNYIDKVGYLNGKQIEVTEHNYTEFEGKRIEFISPTGCRYTDGVCARCAGRATDKPWAFMPQVHLGSYAKTQLSGGVTQKVLSAKHLISTLTVSLKLFDAAKKYFVKHSARNDLYALKSLGKQFKDTVLVVDANDMNHISDLQYGSLTANGFSILESIGLHNVKTNETEIIPLAELQFMVHLSEDLLHHMRDNAHTIYLVDGSYYIPLKGFKSAKPLLSYVVVNDDMVAFADRIKNMVAKDIKQFTSPASAVSELASIVYGKTNLNIFWIEVIIKSLMSGAVDEHGCAKFNTMKGGIADSSVATKLGHETIKKYFQQAETSVVSKGPSPLDVFFAF